MQVKKFEAKTMKEALDLVKVHLGPEAIILSAKDSHRGFGLMGDTSVEVTAAVSDEVLRRKKMAEAKLREDLRQKFQQIPAAKQKEFINRVFETTTAEGKQTRGVKPRELAMAGHGAASGASVGIPQRTQNRPASSTRYIDIVDEEVETRDQSRDRVRNAAQRARMASQEILQDRTPAKQPTRAQANVAKNAKAAAAAAAAFNQSPAPAVASPSEEVRMLESQVRELQAVVERFQKIPQMTMTMHPGAEQGVPYELSAMYQRLTGQGVQPQIVTSLLKKAQREMDSEALKKPALIDAWMVRHLLNNVEVSAEPTASRYHVFMGSTGQGKTTSLVKFASNLVLKEKKTIAIISLDTIKVGAADQLRIYAQILNVPFAIVRRPEEWQVAQAKLGHVQHILVDCPGFNLRSMEEVEWLKQMIPPAELNRKIHYVQSVLARDEETFDLAGRYQMLGFHDVIFTRLDESSRQGLMLNFQDRFKVPLHSFGFGSKIPEDYEFATKERVIDFIFKLSKISKREENNG